MKNTYTAYLSLGLLLSATSAIASNQTELMRTETVVVSTQEITIQKVQQEIDQELHSLFQRFFDQDDEMSFAHFATEVTALLQAQKNLLDGQEQIKCEKWIETFEKNKNNISFAIWLPILLNKDLHSLMSHTTRTYIYNVPQYVKMQAFMAKLRK